MRKFWVMSVLVLTCNLPVLGEQPVGAPAKAVHFDGETLPLAFEQANQTETLAEYIPAGQTLERWTQLAAIRHFRVRLDPAAAVGALARRLKETNPLAPSKILENPQTGEVMIDFVTWPESGEFVEFNIFKYHKAPDGTLVAEQYALRAYEDSEDFLRKLRPVRERLVELMAREGLQVEVRTALPTADR